MSSKSGVFTLLALALVAVTGLVFSSMNETGASVSVAPQASDVPHVLVAARPQKCLSDSYCPPAQSCVNGVCVKDYASGPNEIAEPTPNYASYDPGGQPVARAGSPQVHDPSFPKPRQGLTYPFAG